MAFTVRNFIFGRFEREREREREGERERELIYYMRRRYYSKSLKLQKNDSRS